MGAFDPYRVTEETLQRPTKSPWPPVLSPSKRVVELARAMERLDQDLQRIEVPDDQGRRILRDALARNAYGTSSMEGNPLSLEEVESLLARSPTPEGRIEPEEREILNHHAVMRDLDAVRVPRDVTDLCALHGRYFEGVQDGAGGLKQKQNFVGDRATKVVRYVPTPPGRTRAELAASLDWLHEAPEHPLVKAAVWFHEFQSIHPFRDGNGRLGRLVFTIYLWHEGYRGLRYALLDWAINQERSDYYDHLDLVRRGGWDRTPWVEYLLGLLHDAYRDALRRLLQIGRLPQGLNDRQVRVVEWFAAISRDAPGRRAKFADVHAAFPHVPRRTLTHDLGRLAAAGVLEREGERRHTTYRLRLTRDGGAMQDRGRRPR